VRTVPVRLPQGTTRERLVQRPPDACSRRRAGVSVEQEPFAVARHGHDTGGGDHGLNADPVSGRVYQVRGLCVTVGDADVDAVQLERKPRRAITVCSATT
jgi:hypothetical protein